MTTPEPSELLPTSSLVAGKYRLVRLLGRGGMGSVWEARHTSLGTTVAIKFVEAETARNEQARARFENEAHAAAAITSKHAIKVYDHGVLEDGRPYIVMEMLTGEPLDKRLDRVGRLPLAETARLVYQIARALQEAHDSGITHRDLKPENIFLQRSADDDEDVAKVLDFGIAKMGGAQALGVSSTTKTGVIMGTPFFMSPEQARGLRTVDPRSDLWSLGVIVFRCVTGVLPFDGEALGDLLVAICAEPIPIPSHVAPDVSPRFDSWMARALDRDPQRRFQSAGELADSLAMIAGVSRRPLSMRTPPGESPVPQPPRLPTVSGVSERPPAPAPDRSARLAGVAALFALAFSVAAAGGVFALVHSRGASAPVPPQASARAPEPIAPPAMPPNPSKNEIAVDARAPATDPSSVPQRPPPPTVRPPPRVVPVVAPPRPPPPQPSSLPSVPTVPPPVDTSAPDPGPNPLKRRY